VNSNNPKPRLSGLNIFLYVTVAGVPLMLGAASASADTAPAQQSGQVETVVVTAEKRAQAIIDVPAAITAIDGKNLQTLNATNMPQVAAQIPNFAIKYDRGPGTVPDFTLRGVSGDALTSRLNEASVAIYTDSVYLGDESMLNGLVFDEQRVEVLRGPQGTVFGQNTTGGLVNFISNAPTDELSGFGSVLYGANNKVTLEGALSGPISDNVRVRIAGMWNYSDGDWRNTDSLAGKPVPGPSSAYNNFTAGGTVPTRLGGTNIGGLRATVDVDFDAKSSFRLMASYVHNDSYEVAPLIIGFLQPGTAGPGPYTPSQLCNISQVYSGKCVTKAQIYYGLSQYPLEPGVGDSDNPAKNLKAGGQGASITGQFTHDFGWATLTSLTNFTDNWYSQGIEPGRWSPDYVPPTSPTVSPFAVGYSSMYDVQYRHNASQLSQEVRLNGSTSSFDWVVGAFYYMDDKFYHLFSDISIFGINDYSDARVKSHELSAFGQLDNHITDELTLTVGARWTAYDRSYDKAIIYNPLTAKFQDIHAYMQVYQGTVGPGATEVIGSPVSDNKDVTGKVALDWKPSEEDAYYISASRGIKATGYNDGFATSNTIATNAEIAGPSGEETLDALEVGAKNRFFDRKLSINSDVYFYNYEGKQEELITFDPSTGLVAYNYVNVGVVQAWGVETEIAYQPDEHWDFNLALGTNHNEITKSSLSSPDPWGNLIPLQGKHLEHTPDYTFNAIVAYHLPTDRLGTFTLQSEVNGTGSQNWSIINDPVCATSSYILTNFRILWESPDETYSAQAYVTNAFNTLYVAGNLNDTVVKSGGGVPVTIGAGRLWGVKFGAHF